MNRFGDVCAAVECSFAEFCEVSGTRPMWRSCGCRETGDGFTIRSAASVDWTMLVARALERAGRRDMLGKLGIGV